MKISKYNASGNDFAIFHTFTHKNRGDLAKQICDRFSGVGADGLIVLVPINGDQNSKKECDFAWEFYNSDGSAAAMCGNGSRAAALYAYENELGGAKMSFLTGAGKIVANIYDDGVEIAFSRAKMVQKSFKEAGRTWHFYDTGVPHLVNFVANLDEFDLNLARLMREKYNANVNFATILPSGEIGVRTYERGVENETNACGTGMAACFWVALQTGILGQILGENFSANCQNEADFIKTNAKSSTTSADFTLENKVSNLDEISSQNMANLKANFNEIKTNLNENQKQISTQNEILTCQSVILRPKSGEKLYFRAQDGTIFFKGAVRHCFDAEYFLQ